MKIIINILGSLIFILSCDLVIAQKNVKQTSICNPINLSYRFQLEKPSRREAADPTMIVFKGKYYLFASKSGCYWSSTDMINWKMITSPDLPFEDYAPTVVNIKDTLYFLATNWMNNSKSLYKTADPSSGRWQVAVETFSKIMSDPALFLDDDGRLYFYYGTSNQTPIYGVELDAKTFKLLGEPVSCLNSDINNHGWERTGDYNTKNQRPYIEGAWMTKHGGKYYLQYAAPGTEMKSYNDGLYIGDSPLGPFKLAANNPFSYKPEGFITGAGHSSTFQDKWENFWHISTMVISVKHMFERRLGIFPAFFDKEGTFYTYTGFGDYPHSVPQKKIKGPEDYQPSWMLLSYNKPVEVSSSLPNHPKENITGEEIKKYWSAETNNKGEWLTVDLLNQCKVNAIQINYAEEGTSILGNKIGRADSIYYQYLLEYSNDMKSWKTLVDKTSNKTDVPHDYIELSIPITAKYIRLTNYHVPDGKFAISSLRIFGKGTGLVPQTVSNFTVARDTADKRNVTINWKKQSNVVCYNIRYGTAPNKLYENYQVLNTDSLTIHSLDKMQQYFFTIDAFNENGITKGKVIVEGK
jgi:xylan 1,4-beta-xylosidase